MMNIDMKKAYDFVEWSYLEQVLAYLQLPEKFIQWIMQCTTTVSYSILINGEPTKPFKANKGLRQGDSLLPYLFVLAMEYLTRILKTLRKNPDFNYHPKCSKMNIIQLSFADDLLLFSRGDIMSVQLVFQCFQQFSKASGLIANKEKSSIIFGGVREEQQQQILDGLGFVKGELPVRYLGVPLSTKRLSLIQCQPLIEKMLGRIQSWTTKFLSYAGRIQLIKSVLFSIQIYWSQIFFLPKKLIRMIEKVCRTFL